MPAESDKNLSRVSGRGTSPGAPIQLWMDPLIREGKRACWVGKVGRHRIGPLSVKRDTAWNGLYLQALSKLKAFSEQGNNRIAQLAIT